MFGGQSAGLSLRNICRVKMIFKTFFLLENLQSLLKSLAVSAVVFARERMTAKQKVVPAKREVNFVLPRVQGVNKCSPVKHMSCEVRV